MSSTEFTTGKQAQGMRRKSPQWLLMESLDTVTIAGVVLVTLGAVLGAAHQSAK